MLGQRAASAAVGVPIILGVVALGGVGYAIALAFVLSIAALEYYAAVAPAANPVAAESETKTRPGLALLLGQRPLGYLGAALVALLVAAAHNGSDWWTATLALAIFVTFLWLIGRGQVAAALQEWLIALGGVLYIGFLGSHLVFLRGLENGRDWTMLAVFATFSADTAAYFVGRALGRRPLALHISRGKTVEGSLGGFVAGALAVVLLNWALGLRLSVGAIVPLALLLPLAAAVGDLGESLVKRGAGIKDASALVPGHGGFLDRLDSILFTTVLVYYYVVWVILP